MEYRASQEVDADAETVWAVMSDVERMPDWTPTMTRVELLDGGPLRLGSRVRIAQPRLPTATWEVTALEPGRSFGWSSPAPGLRSVATHAVEPLGPGRCRVTLTFAQTGPLAILAELLGPMTRRYVDTELAGLASESSGSSGSSGPSGSSGR